MVYLTDQFPEGLETPIDQVIFSVKNVHVSACSLKVLRASPGTRNLLHPSFPPVFVCS